MKYAHLRCWWWMFHSDFISDPCALLSFPCRCMNLCKQNSSPVTVTRIVHYFWELLDRCWFFKVNPLSECKLLGTLMMFRWQVECSLFWDEILPPFIVFNHLFGLHSKESRQESAACLTLDEIAKTLPALLLLLLLVSKQQFIACESLPGLSRRM